MSNDTGHESGEESDEREGPNQQYVFNGKPCSYVNIYSAIFISNQKQLRLSSSQSLDHEISRKFTEQCLANDCRTTLETLIDGTSWTVILLRAIALYADNSEESRSKLQDIQELKPYVLKKDTDYLQLDYVKWSVKNVSNPLQHCYPKVTNFNSRSSNFYTLAEEIFPEFDFSNNVPQDEFFRKTLNLINELNKGDVTDEQQLLVIKTWMDLWPKKFTTTFTVWLARRSNKTVDEFLSNLSQYCGEARLAKGVAETFHWTVLPNANTSCYQGHKRSLDNDNHNQDAYRGDK
jgi:hypothetical protein